MRRPWLVPLVPLYAAGLGVRSLRLRRGWETVRRLQDPVISIGNLSTGGSGKTPLAIALAKLLAARGVHVDVLSRGYGRSSSEPARVDPNGTAEQYGDEPLLIARETGAPVYVAPRRYDAGLIAESEAKTRPYEPADGRIAPAHTNADDSGQQDASRKLVTRAHILDDGFQHRQLHRDLDILLLNRDDWHDRLLPAGNLREPLPALKRAHVVAIPAEDAGLEAELRRWGWTGPVWRMHRHMQIPKVNEPVFAFCGIARPEQFFTGLELAGLRLAARKAFRDHHRYTSVDANGLIASARAAGSAALVTTEKDAVRLGPLSSAFPRELPLTSARLHVEIEGANAAVDWLLERLASPSAASAL